MTSHKRELASLGRITSASGHKPDHLDNTDGRKAMRAALEAALEGDVR